MFSPRALLIDLDGVLHVSGKPIPGAVAAISDLRRRGIPFRLLTNTTRKSRRKIHSHLLSMGFDIAEAEIFSAGQAGVSFLDAQGSPPCLLFVNDDIQEDYRRFEAGDRTAEWVVIGDRQGNWSHEDTNRAFRAMMAGARLLALHKGRYFQVADGLDVDIGVYVAGL